MRSLVQDLRYGARILARSPGFTVVAVLTLALAIGANTAIFSLVNGIILKPLPYKNPDRLALIFEVVPAMRERYPLLPAAASHFESWRDQSQSFVNMTAFRWARMALTGAGEPRMVGAARVSASFLNTLGTPPRMGRDFTPADDQPGSDSVVIISDRLWHNQFGASASVIGRTLRLDGRPFEIIGVLPPGFRFAQAGASSSFGDRIPEADVFKPVAFQSKPLDSQYNYNVIARLGPGISQEEALAELNVIQSSIAGQIGEGAQLQAALRPMHETMVGDVRTGLYLVLAAVGAVLLIACVNLANLLLVRSSVRRREMAIRTALGAGEGRLLRQAMVESLCLAVVGGILGVAIAYRVVGVFVRHAPVSLPRLAEVGVDGNVLAFAGAVTLLSALFFGLAPAWRSARTDPQEALQTGVRGGGDRAGAHRMRSVLVGAEVALSSMLLVAAGLLVHSFMRVMSRDTGLRDNNVVAVEITLPPTSYGDADAARRTAAYTEMVDRVARLPGVRAAAAVSQLPLTREYEVRSFLPREAAPIPWMERPTANQRWITPGYFDASGIQLRSGRTFREDDREGRPVVISETVAKTFWPGQNAVGREMRDHSDKLPFLRVVGVAADVPVASLEKDSAMVVYAPHWDEPQLSMAIVVRTAMDPAGFASSIRKAVWEIEPEVPVPEPKTMQRLVSESVGARRFNLALVALFAATALSLACLGIYGLLSYSVAQRTGEIGVRLALGARAVDIGLLVLRWGMLPVIVGLAIGLAAAVGFSELLTSMLFEVAPLDAATFLAVPSLLVAAALAACLIPVLRAARVPPMTALRYE